MPNFLELDQFWQIIIVAGFLATEIVHVGENTRPTVERYLLQVLSFGVSAQLLMAVVIVGGIANFCDGWAPPVLFSQAAVLAIGVLLGCWWRSAGSRWISWLMSRFNIYQDDHLSSVMTSLKRAPAVWHVVQIRLTDGTTLEMCPDRFSPNHRRVGPDILFNDDGFLLYITSTFTADGIESKSHWGDPDYGAPITFVPMSQIAKVKVSWQTKQNS